MMSDLVANFRDLGGIEIGHGRFIAPGRLFRSSGLAYLESTTRQVIAEVMSKATYIDLRTDKEISRDGGLADLVSSGWSWTRVPIDELALDLAVVHQIYDRVAQDILKQRRFDGPIIVACSLGKDRTGHVIARLLTAMGARRQTVLNDYLRSNTQLEAQTHLLPDRFKSTRNGYEPVHSEKLQLGETEFQVSAAASSYFIEPANE